MKKWLRVTKREKCVICQHPDWCTYCLELNLANCMRVVSDRPSKNGGYLHSLNGENRPKYEPRHEPEPIPIDTDGMMTAFAQDTTESDLSGFAVSLGVTTDSLRSLGCQRAKVYNAWAFPMRNALGQACGIRLRNDQGAKFAVTGSRQGIFIPSKVVEHTVFIVEGPTDLAALLSIGLYGIGRPCCVGCIAIITAFLSRCGIKRVVIVADNDEPGIKGANELSKELDVPNIVYITPLKDLRESVTSGLTKELLLCTVQNMIWTVPNKLAMHSGCDTHRK